MDEPTSESVTALAERAGLSLDRGRIRELLTTFEERDDVLEPLREFEAGRPPERTWWEPDEDEDPNGAFLVRCDIDPIADGSLDGTTVGVKDNIAVAGVPMTCGSPLLQGYVPPSDATVVRRLAEAGARVVGKTNMDEFAMGGSASTMRFRTARNPNDPSRHPGGSSSGSGVAVAEGSVDVALGSDSGGSVRFPAAWCGVLGMKPTRSLISHHGFVQYAKTLDCIGVLARTAADAARTLEAIAGPDVRDGATAGMTVGNYASAVERGLDERPTSVTIGVPAELFGRAEALDEVVDKALDRLAAAGATLQEVSLRDFEYARPAWLAMATTEFGAYLDARTVNYWRPAEYPPSRIGRLHDALAGDVDQLGGTVVENWLYRRSLSERTGNQTYALAQRARCAVTEGVDEALADVDVLAGVTVPRLPPERGSGIEDLLDATANTRPFSLTGHPAVSVPAGVEEGLPVGMQFVGSRGDEASVLRAAAHWESVRDE